MRKFAIVVWHTFCKQVKSWSFVMLFSVPLLLLAVTFGTEYFIINSMGDTYAVVSNNPEISKPFVKANVEDYVDDTIKTVSIAKKSLQNVDIDGYVDIEVKRGQIQADYFGTKKIDSKFKKRLVKYLKQLQNERSKKDSKLNSSQTHLTPVLSEHLQKMTINLGEDPHLFLSTIFGIMFVIVGIYTNITAQEIAADKGTKIIEVIFSSISAVKYFTGKITGILGLVVFQLLIYLIIGATGLEMIKHIPQAAPFMAQTNLLAYARAIVQSLLGIKLVYLLLGIILFMILAAYCGAVVKRTEDASKAAQPVTYFSFVILFIGLISSNISTLKNPIIVFLSFIPGFSSFFMPLRLITKTANNWESAFSLLILIGCIGLLVFSVGKSYKRLMLQNDSKPFWQKLKKS
ncbi:ABC-2 type transport system permease protein [Lactobacillus bombicola]|uniref:ABC-2 type transport system permease protein n=1 Tax=Lactobacillus bombicola TaxID=1505723 RepID=A0A1I1RAN7_9LACO|nr:ABC transporter permease [Lactobacillus bombicola]SFD31421.1 ABC-2 type transport system permease protein [Lactobacillus bombicola]